jgi:hypothetical protein
MKDTQICFTMKEFSETLNILMACENYETICR